MLRGIAEFLRDAFKYSPGVWTCLLMCFFFWLMNYPVILIGGLVLWIIAWLAVIASPATRCADEQYYNDMMNGRIREYEPKPRGPWYETAGKIVVVALAALLAGLMIVCAVRILKVVP